MTIQEARERLYDLEREEAAYMARTDRQAALGLASFEQEAKELRAWIREQEKNRAA